MGVPKVAIVGRPNVGKSSLFNWLVGKRVAIVDPTAGVTRDRVDRLIEEAGRFFELIDTGGMGIDDADGLTGQVEAQIDRAIREADLLLFVLDARDPLTALDRLVAERIRQSNKPVLAVANKCDNPTLEALAAGEHHALGFDLVFTSVTAHRGKDDLLESIVARLPESIGEPQRDAELKLAVVGKTNVGKSTFINCLARDERMIVSEVPGTTRDSVDVRFEHHGKAFVAIDTAGVRRKAHHQDDIAFYSHVRAKETIRRADVVLLFLDPTTPIGRIDKHLAREIVEQHKPCVFVVNKWDLMRPRPTGEFDEYLVRSLPDLSFAPRAYITAKTGRNAQKLIDLAQHLWKQANQRASTAEINRILGEAVAKQPPPLRKNRRAKIYYGSQVAVAPPTIVFFCNDPDLLSASYKRYLLNFFREALPYDEVPIRVHYRRRGAESMAGEDARPPRDSAEDPSRSRS